MVIDVTDWKTISISGVLKSIETFWAVGSKCRQGKTKEKYPGLPWWRSGWESACQCRGHGFNPWCGKIPHAAEQLSPCATTTELCALEPVSHNYWACALEPMSHNYWAWALEPVSHNYWAHVPQLLKPTCLEPVLHNERSHGNEKPAHCNEE